MAYVLPKYLAAGIEGEEKRWMLRIDEELIRERNTRLRIEGNLVKEWNEVLQSNCLGVLNRGGELELDLAGVCFADLDGVDLLRRLEQSGVRLINSPPFLMEQLKQVIG